MLWLYTLKCYNDKEIVNLEERMKEVDINFIQM